MSIISTLGNGGGGQRLSKTQLLLVASSALSLTIWACNVIKRSRGRGEHNRDELAYLALDKSRSRSRAEPFSESIAKLRAIIKLIVGPKEMMYFTGVALTLLAKTANDLWLINNGTQIEAAIITADVEKLKHNLGGFFIYMPTLAIVNNSFKFFLNQLRLNLRYKLSVVLYNKYVDGLTFYRLNAFDHQCQNIDQLLTNDVEKFCNTIVDVYSNVSKPLLDIIILVQRLSSSSGAAAPCAMIGYLMVAGGILTQARRPLTSLTVKESRLEGQLRYVHSRLIANCEEIAFYQGNNKERSILVGALTRLKNHLYNVSMFKFNVDYLDNMIARYFATVVGYMSLAIPFLTTRYAAESQAVRLEAYYKSGRMMVRLAESIGRLVLAGRDFSKLAAYTSRVTQLMNSIEKNRSSSFARPSESMKSRVELEARGAQNGLVHSGDNLDNGGIQQRQLIAGSGSVQLCDIANPVIIFREVPLCTPSGDLLINSLSLTIKHGSNVIITGPNGSGKSSLFRLLGELWPLHGGQLIKPPNNKLFYIPQKPYLTLGSFRDQIIYPDTLVDMARKGICDNHLRDILEKVELSYLLDRESLDSVLDWQEVLSGGEKQRVALARLVYQKPLFAILDECTSAVSIDVEQKIYEYLTNVANISLMSVTHRVKQLQQYHHFVLRFDGNGDYVYEPLKGSEKSQVDCDTQ